MQFTMSSGGIPAGSYRARFVEAAPHDDNAEKYGPGVLLKWQVLDGEQGGNETSRICSAKMTPKTALGRFAVAFRGGAIAPGESFSFADYAGVSGIVIVEATENGGTRVGTFLPDAQPSGQATPPNTQGQVTPIQPPTTPEHVERF